MKYILSLLLFTSLSFAGQEPSEEVVPSKEPQIHLYILMNGERHKIQVYNSAHKDLNACERTAKLIRQGGHTRDVVFCGTNLKEITNTRVVLNRNKQ